MFKYQTALFSLGIAAVITACGSSVAKGDATFFADRQSFEAATKQITAESFESPVSAGSSMQFNDLSIEEISSSPWIRRSTAATFATDGFASLEYFSDGNSVIKLTFEEEVTAFAIDFISFGNAGGGKLTLQDNGSTPTSKTVAVAPPSLMPLNQLFIGYVSPDSPFTEVMITSSTAGDTIAMDDLSFGEAVPVPEPSAMILLLFSVATYGIVGRRRRGSTRS